MASVGLGVQVQRVYPLGVSFITDIFMYIYFYFLFVAYTSLPFLYTYIYILYTVYTQSV